MNLTQFDMPGITKLCSGKVREVFDLGRTLLLVATDRISAFDVVFDEPIPDKGQILTQLSLFWFGKLPARIPHHVITAHPRDYPSMLSDFTAQLDGRSMLVRKCEALPVECVVRGYLAGSGWREYQETGSVCGVELPKNLRQADQLPEPIFTPAAKASKGHDVNISWDQMVERVGAELAEKMRRISLEIYEMGAAHADKAGIIMADTKFEFGLHRGELMLIDECLTPDSSRFWPKASYQPGGSPPSFDKQFIRDYLESLDWNKKPPPPKLPPEVIEQTRRRYQEAFTRLTSKTE